MTRWRASAIWSWGQVLTSCIAVHWCSRWPTWRLRFAIQIQVSLVIVSPIISLPKQEVHTKCSVARAVAPLLEDALFDIPAGCVDSAATSFASKKGFLETGRATTGPSMGLVAPEPTLFRKGLLEAKGEDTRSGNILGAVSKAVT